MMTESVPTIEWEGRTFIMVPQATNRLVQGGDGPVVISRAEVEGTIRKLEKYAATNHPAANAEKLAAYQQLLAGAK